VFGGNDDGYPGEASGYASVETGPVEVEVGNVVPSLAHEPGKPEGAVDLAVALHPEVVDPDTPRRHPAAHRAEVVEGDDLGGVTSVPEKQLELPLGPPGGEARDDV